MIHKTIKAASSLHPSAPQTSPTNSIRVTFELPSCTWACRIFVCGDFNGWDKSATPMRQERDGVWRATVDLEPNRRYLFRYLIDGNWQSDYHADGWSESGYGSENSIVDTGVLSDALIEDPHTLALLYPYIDTANTVEGRQPESTVAPPVVIATEERTLLSKHPVRQRTAAVRRAA